jgi:hypothetical protein
LRFAEGVTHGLDKKTVAIDAPARNLS